MNNKRHKMMPLTLNKNTLKNLNNVVISERSLSNESCGTFFQRKCPQNHKEALFWTGITTFFTNYLIIRILGNRNLGFNGASLAHW